MSAGRSPGLLAAVGIFAMSTAVLIATIYYGVERLLPGDQPGAQTAVENTNGATLQTRGQDVSRIVDAHLFGAAGESTRSAVAEAPETKLQLKLIGLISSADDQLARAIIGVNGKARVKPYAVGQTIDGTDAAIHSVERRRVLLKRGETLESLGLKRETIFEFGDTTSDGSPGHNPSFSRQQPVDKTGQVTEFRQKAGAKQMKLPF